MIGQSLVVHSLALLQAAPPNPGEMTQEQFNQQIALEAIRRGTGHTALDLLVPLGFFALILVIVWLVQRKKQLQIQAKAEFNKQLLDKFSSGREFADFLESKGSQRFLDELWSQGKGAKDRILGSLRIGVVLTILGLGLLALTAMKRAFAVPAVVALALGIGFLISTAISYRLSKQWSQDQGPDSRNAPAS